MIHIEVLGLGCPKCAKLAHRAAEAAQRLGLPCKLEKVQALARILEVGAAVPALLIDGAVRSAGTLPTVTEIMTMLSPARDEVENRVR